MMLKVQTLVLATAWLGLGMISLGQDRSQNVPLQSLSSLHSQRFAGGEPSGAGGGGASLANFSELMMLIESVIDAPWLNNGGTATMFPFRNGVRIDPKGLIERLDEAQPPVTPALRIPVERPPQTPGGFRLDELGAWQTPSNLRWVSLHRLDEQLAECLSDNRSANIAMEVLGGICRIDYVAFDPATKEWLLGGPAGNIAADEQGVLLHSELRLPPILLEDLLTVAPHVLNERGEFGCSIDPVHERLVSALKMAQSSTALRDLRSDPDHWASEWKTKLGRQRTRIIGLPDDSPTGYALLIADAHMKRIALGLEPAPAGLANYWLEADSISQVHRGPMVRWWFTLSENRIPWDPDRKIAHFNFSNVQVLSESQMLDSKGDRVPSDRPDWAADTFAKKFTQKFDVIQRSHAAYGRLRHVFDLAVALEIIRSQIEAGHGKPFQALPRFDLQPHLPVAPKEIDSVVATRRFSDGGVSAIVSGGVSVTSRATRDRLRRDSQRFDSIGIETSPDATSPGQQQPQHQNQDKPFWR